MCLVPRWNGALCTPCSVTTMSSFSTTERLSRWTSYKDQHRNSLQKYVLSQSPSRYYNHPQTMLTTITKCSAVTKINSTTHRKNIVTITPGPCPLIITLKQSSLLSPSPRLSSPLSPYMLTGDPSTMGERSTLWSLWQLWRKHKERDARQGEHFFPSW